MKEKKALDKEWAVIGGERSRFILSTGEVVASMISPDFAAIFGIFINLVSISGNIHNTFSLLHEIQIEIRKHFVNKTKMTNVFSRPRAVS